MRISDWSSDVCSSDLGPLADIGPTADRRYPALQRVDVALRQVKLGDARRDIIRTQIALAKVLPQPRHEAGVIVHPQLAEVGERSEERREGKEGVSTFRHRWSP